MREMTTLEMEMVEGGKLPCWLAWTLYGVALVGLGATTGGWGAVAALAGYGGSILSVIDNCTSYFDKKLN